MDSFSSQSYGSLQRILSDKRLEELRSKIKIKYESEKINWDERVVNLSDLGESSWKPTVLVAIDGDYSASKIETGFPGSEIGYITVSSVIIRIDKIRELEEENFIDPVRFRKTELPSSIDGVFLGCNAIIKGEKSAQSSMRRMLYEELKKYSVFPNGETLLDTYEALLKIRIEGEDKGQMPECPNSSCDRRLEGHLGESYCQCGEKIFSTDFLRLHELMNPSGSNGEMYGQIKEAIKKLQLIHILRSLEANNHPLFLQGDIAFFLEGSLAVFSTPSWLAKCFRKELFKINARVREASGKDLIILGVEKSGNFVNHFSDIDTNNNGEKDNFPNQSVFLPDNEYICKNIVYNENDDFVYLKDTAFGRKFFYKTKLGHRVVPSVVTYNEFQSSVETAFPEQYPRLVDCLKLLDNLVSSQYGNSVMPLASAHAEAAIPLNLGKRVFDELAKEIKENK